MGIQWGPEVPKRHRSTVRLGDEVAFSFGATNIAFVRVGTGLGNDWESVAIRFSTDNSKALIYKRDAEFGRKFTATPSGVKQLAMAKSLIPEAIVAKGSFRAPAERTDEGIVVHIDRAYKC